MIYGFPDQFLVEFVPAGTDSVSKIIQADNQIQISVRGLL